MNIEQKLAFRELLSDVLHYMVDTTRDKNEILVMTDRLEDSIDTLITGCVLGRFPSATLEQLMLTTPERVQLRLHLATALELISRRNMTGEQMVKLIHDVESWLEGVIDKKCTAVIGKPKFRISKGQA